MTGPGEQIGIIAGSGSLPREVAESIVARGGSVHVVMVGGAAEASLAMFPHTVVNWAQPGRATAALKAAGVRNVVMLGGFQRPDFRTARPDLAFFQALPSVLRFLKAGGDDAVLRGLVALFERRGLSIVGVREAAGDLLVGDGVLAGPTPAKGHIADAETGFALIAALGRYDIGQGVVVANGRVEAIEGAEGTDRMLQRLAEARRKAGTLVAGGVLVKRPKPGQDLRVDLPAIGPNTIENVAAAGLSGIAVMAGHVLAAERQRMVAMAEAKGVFVTGIAQQAAPVVAQCDVGDAGGSVGWLGSIAAVAHERADVRRGTSILADAAIFDTGTAVVLDRGRVIAIGADESALSVVQHAQSLRRNDRRRGVAVIGRSQMLDAELLQAASQCKLAGIGVRRGAANAPIGASVIALANSLGTFVAEADDRPHEGVRDRGRA